ncbi:bacterio-opsin activator domain-containing protein [Halalkalicoccus salilacus]|uniref:bacterio-opsin activator domain-containing protein n=1 Tax=Halalkalicoccus TaxID=332246 RepID=UPI002F9682F0
MQLERVIPAGDRTISLIWIHAANPEPAEQELREHRLVKLITRLETFEDRTLYRIDWAEEPDSVFTEIRTQRAVLLDAVGVGESWQFELRFPTHTALSEFHANCKDAEIPLTICSPTRSYRSSRHA